MNVDIEIELEMENETSIEEKRRFNILRNREFMQQIGLELASKILKDEDDEKDREQKKLEKKAKESTIPKGEERRSSRITLKPKVDYKEKTQKYTPRGEKKHWEDGDEDYDLRGSQRSTKSPRRKYKLRDRGSIDYSLLDVFEFNDNDTSNKKESPSSKQKKRSKMDRKQWYQRRVRGQHNNNRKATI
eukprot:TRINITY_DN515_c0_g6_i4.p2 TRINITY_DN515_c0_g6~~TRINITY_DN515_c0_g6_i4.p2  ORF type:complete len:188 (+),score=56.53 TRINITY_DN515_c0_g6_i4:156-719(+)